MCLMHHKAEMGTRVYGFISLLKNYIFFLPSDFTQPEMTPYFTRLEEKDLWIFL